jgi:4-amino-4-deoxy-L-arabinose transferase-like glycosyltransferase
VTRSAPRARELALLLPLLGLFVAMALVFPSHPDDEASYVTLADRLVHGSYVTGDNDALLDADPGSPDLWFGPGLPTVLAPLAALDVPLSVMRMLGPLALFLACGLFYVLARDRWGRRIALIATYALGLYPPFWALLPNLHSEPLAILFVVAAMLGIARFLHSGSRGSFTLAAAALAALALTRVAYGWVLTLVLVVLLLRLARRRAAPIARSAAIVAAALLLCVPWLAYTAAKTGRPLVWGNSGSLSLYWMASPHDRDLGDWHQADETLTDPRLAPHKTFFQGLRGLTLAEQNARIERRALRNIADHPAKYGENLVANGSRLLFNTPYSATSQSTNDVFYALPNALVVGAVAFCLLALAPRRRRLPPEALPFALLGVVGVALHLLVAAYPRMLTPIIPVVVWFTTLALVEAGLLTARREQPAGAPAGTPAPSSSA